MSEGTSSTGAAAPEKAQTQVEDFEYSGRKQGKLLGIFVSLIAAAWSLFQLWIASPLPFIFDFALIVDVPARGIHLAFGLLLCFLTYPAARSMAARPIPIVDIVLAIAGCLCALYLFLAAEGLATRAGILLG